ncbi:hypothetical protein [Rheinheimera tilapiae]|uniref:Uncharacterized protein n=1 Tax=Rheinheimera tilapiae TaxID=875043 RepID=A0ABV6BFM3_9GAMM
MPADFWHNAALPNTETHMLQATRYLSYFFLLSYFVALIFTGVMKGTVYQDPLHVQYMLMSLGLAYLAQFVQSQTMLTVVFAVILTALVKICTQMYGWHITERAIGGMNLGYLIAYLLCIQQLVKLKKQHQSRN